MVIVDCVSPLSGTNGTVMMAPLAQMDDRHCPLVPMDGLEKMAPLTDLPLAQMDV